MKKLTAYIILTVISASVNLCFAQIEVSSQDIRDKVTTFINQLQQDKSYEVINTTIDQISKGGTKSFTINLEPSSEYIVTIFGDNGIDKLTLDISYNGSSSVLKFNSEITTASVPVGIIKPNASSEYEFTVKDAKYNGNNVSGNFAVIVYRKNQ